MPSFGASLHLLLDHMWLGVAAALLFVAGLATAGPVVRHDYRALMDFPLAVLRLVLRLIGPELRAVRVFLVIFLFNASAIFLYMLSGVLVVVPAVVAFLTGVNIGVVMLKGGEIAVPGDDRPLASVLAPREPSHVPRWVGRCGLLVLALELPSFWISVGMGIGMARKLTAAGQYTLANMGALVTERVHAYWMIILPALLLSAFAETAAIRGHTRAGGDEAAEPPGHDGEQP
ncbi:MAG TPA: hypothetical protein VNE39_02215 [Planctomycetota bacterium]|nr:hypothetical protein [Planctomycetota bacterium]